MYGLEEIKTLNNAVKCQQPKRRYILYPHQQQIMLAYYQAELRGEWWHYQRYLIRNNLNWHRDQS